MTVSISFEGKNFNTKDGESVLDCLSRNGISVPHSCRSGVCQSCLMQATEGVVPEMAQKGLKTPFTKQNLFLSCQCTPSENMTVRLPEDSGLDTHAVITGISMLNHNVMQLTLQPETEFICEPGQYLTLINGDGVARSYSVANDPTQEGVIELHIRLLKDGAMSRFLNHAAKLGDDINIRGPAGNCFYVSEEGDDFPIVLAGTGTGLAPLYGIAKQALAKGHKGFIHLFHGALQDADLYLVDQLQALGAQSPNFRYTPCVLNGADHQFYKLGNIEEIVMAALPANKTETRLFLCGAPDLVNALKRKAFLDGLASKHIFADAFLPSKSAPIAA